MWIGISFFFIMYTTLARKYKRISNRKQGIIQKEKKSLLWYCFILFAFMPVFKSYGYLVIQADNLILPHREWGIKKKTVRFVAHRSLNLLNRIWIAWVHIVFFSWIMTERCVQVQMHFRQKSFQVSAKVYIYKEKIT